MLEEDSVTDERLLERRGAILGAAEKVFDAHGYAAATMAAVAAQAGIAKGSIYNYFRSKHDLFTQVCTDALAGGQADLERLVGQSLAAAAKIALAIDIWFQGFEHYKRVGRLVLEFWATAAREKPRGELTVTFESLAGQGVEQIQAIIEQGITSGEFAREVNAEVAAQLIVDVLRGITVEAIVLGSDIDGAFVTELKRGILAGLSARASGQNDDQSEMAQS